MVVGFDDVSKVYRLGATQGGLREALPRLMRRVVGRGAGGDNESNRIWALRDVSFAVSPGEALGIIGPNGAGKTTALKLLSRITKPTSGHVHTDGRLSALIELGAGFHPELTGRENIYLNGVMLGMTIQEIKERFDAIVAFSELERFLDTPVKRYSSGMYCRLGFSVAAHVDAETLLVDEVLAVGDAGFQAKCYRRIAELKETGTTIVFVTHNLTVMRRVCDRALLLFAGEVVAEGDPQEVIAAYRDNPQYISNLGDRGAHDPLPVAGERTSPDAPAAITRVDLLDDRGRPIQTCRTGESVTMRIGYATRERIAQPSLIVKFRGLDGTHYGGYSTAWDDVVPDSIEGEGYVDLLLSPLCLLPGMYRVIAILADRDDLERYDWRTHAFQFAVVSGGPSAHGLVYMPHTWRWEVGQSEPSRTEIEIG